MTVDETRHDDLAGKLADRNVVRKLRQQPGGIIQGDDTTILNKQQTIGMALQDSFCSLFPAVRDSGPVCRSHASVGLEQDGLSERVLIAIGLLASAIDDQVFLTGRE